MVNHLKSKGSACAGDPDTGDGAGNCNVTRTAAAEALANWLATDPTGQGTVGRELIIGDLNSYDKEDPIDALDAARVHRPAPSSTRARTRTPTSSTGSSATSTTRSPARSCSRRDGRRTVAASTPTRRRSSTTTSSFKSAAQVDAVVRAGRVPLERPRPGDRRYRPRHRRRRRSRSTASPARIFPPNNKPRTVTIDRGCGRRFGRGHLRVDRLDGGRQQEGGDHSADQDRRSR